MIEILQVDTPSLGDRSYLATDGTVALVVDPQRDIDRVLALADERGVRITHVFETHLHNDYLTGGLALARETGAAYHVSAADQVAFDRVPVSDGDVVEVTPSRPDPGAGHPGAHVHPPGLRAGRRRPGTRSRCSPAGRCCSGRPGAPTCSAPAHAAELARAQHASAARLAAELPDRVAVLPTHGFGSFCAATQAASVRLVHDRPGEGPQPGADPRARTVSWRSCWPAWTPTRRTTRGWGRATPRARPRRTCRCPARPARPSCAAGWQAGEWLVDLRSRRVFAAGHLAGSLGFELGDTLAPQLGWLLPAGTPVTLLGETAGQVAAAQRELARIGIDRPAAIATGKPEDWAAGEPLASFPVADFAALAEARREPPGDRAGRPAEPGMGGRPRGRAPSTSRCTSWPGGWARSPAVSCGCTARPATGRR